MHRLATCTVYALAAAASLVSTSGAQGAPPTRSSLPAIDSVYQRARRLVSEGDGTAGRAIVDSILRAAAEGTPAYGDALYWRGELAETALDAERDYRRVIVEYPISRYADDALLALAELEQARGDRAAAYQHLQRFVREHPLGPARARAGLAAARLAFEQRDVTRGCAMIADARLSAANDVELRNQIDYHGMRCPAATAAGSPTPPAPNAGAPSVRASGTPNASASGAAPPPSARPSTTTTVTRTPPSVPTSTTAPRSDTGASRMPAPASAPVTREPTPRGI